MKLTSALVLTVFTLFFTAPSVQAESLGNVIRDGIRGEIRDSIGDSVRRDICRRRAEQNRSTDLCNTLEDVDRLGDALRRGRNGIRAIDAIFD